MTEKVLDRGCVLTGCVYYQDSTSVKGKCSYEKGYCVYSSTHDIEVEEELIRCQSALAEKERELARWRDIAQRNNSSGCCCKIDENNGDPKMLEPCAFHVDWRDLALAEKGAEIERYKKLTEGTASTIEKLEKENGEMEAEILSLRKLLWMSHGHTGQYGDDGEMQCAMCLKEYGFVDWKHTPVDEIVQRIGYCNLRKLAKAVEKGEK